LSKLTREGLEQLRDEIRAGTRLGGAGRRARLTVHLGTCGIASGAGKVLEAARRALGDTPSEDVVLTTSGCAGLCCREPMATVEIAGRPPVKYADLDEKSIVEIIETHLRGGVVVERYALAVGEEKTA
jgi:NADP-reducing hydrogenase subunit HndB